MSIIEKLTKKITNPYAFIPASICGLGSLTAEVLAILIIMRDGWIRTVSVIIIIGIEISKLVFPVLCDPEHKVRTSFSYLIRLSAVLLSACCTFLLISSDLQSPNEVSYNQAIQHNYDSIINNIENQNNLIKENKENAIRIENEIYSTNLSNITKAANEQKEKARETVTSIDTGKTNSYRIAELGTVVDNDIQRIDQQASEDKTREDDRHKAELARINTAYQLNQITDDVHAKAQTEAVERAKIAFPNEGKNPAVQNSVNFITELFSLELANLYELICFLLSLLISAVAESVIWAYTNVAFEDKKLAQI